MQSEDKLCVVVLFGGMSSEHEVSRVSAGTFVDHIDRTRYELMTIGITKEGRWLYTEASSAQMADGSWEELGSNMPCVLSPDRADHGMILFTPAGQVEKIHVDVVIPVLHGLWGDCLFLRKGQILRSTPNTAPLICGAYNTQPEGLSTMA